MKARVKLNEAVLLRRMVEGGLGRKEYAQQLGISSGRLDTLISHGDKRALRTSTAQKLARVFGKDVLVYESGEDE